MSCKDCSNLHYASINNHLNCFQYYSSIEQVDEYILTTLAEHKYYLIIEFCLSQKFKYNEKFVNFIKFYDINDISNYPLLLNIYNL